MVVAMDKVEDHGHHSRITSHGILLNKSHRRMVVVQLQQVY